MDVGHVGCAHHEMHLCRPARAPVHGVEYLGSNPPITLSIRPLLRLYWGVEEVGVPVICMPVCPCGSSGAWGCGVSPCTPPAPRVLPLVRHWTHNLRVMTKLYKNSFRSSDFLLACRMHQVNKHQCACGRACPGRQPFAETTTYAQWILEGMRGLCEIWEDDIPF